MTTSYFNPAHPVTIYVDGSCRGNPGPGGWGVYMEKGDHRREDSGAVPATTNNRMELLAPIKALRRLTYPSTVKVVTDSTYVRDGITSWITKWIDRGWLTSDGSPVANKDLWMELKAEADKHCVQWEWVKAHSGNPGNERADHLARQAALSIN